MRATKVIKLAREFEQVPPLLEVDGEIVSFFIVVESQLQLSNWVLDEVLA